MVVKPLLANDRIKPDSKDKDGRTPLWWAADSGYDAVARILLEQEANADLQGRFEMTALHRAVKKGNLAVARVLLGMEATINLPIRRYSRRFAATFSVFGGWNRRRFTR